MSFRPTISLLLALILGAANCLAVSNSPPAFSRLTVEDGLSSAAVYRIHQDREGFIWLGTAGGLVRYDGNELIVFRPETDDPAEPAAFSVNAIYEDSQGFLWVGGDLVGFSKFDPVSLRFLESYRLDPESGGLESSTVLSIEEAADGKLWIGTDWGGLHRFDPATRSFEHFQLREPQPKNTNRGVVNAIYPSETDPDSVWLGTAWLGLVHLNAASGELRHFRDDPAEAHAVAAPRVAVTSILADAAPGVLLVSAAGANRGLYRFDSVAGRFLERFEYNDETQSENSFGLNSILRDADGQIWVSSSGGGLALFDPETATFESYRYDPTNQQSLSQNHTRDLFQDRAGLIWVATTRAGVCTFDPRGSLIQRHQFFDRQSRTPTPIAATPILEDEKTDGVFWMGGEEGLIRWERRSNGLRFYQHDPNDNTSLSSNRVRSFCRRRAGGTWIGTNDGLNRYDPAADRIVRFVPTTVSAQALSKVRIDALQETRDGKLWLTMKPGLCLFDPATGDAQRLRHNPQDPHSIQPGWVVRIHEDRSGDVWFALRDNGLARYSPETGRFGKYLSDPASADTLSDNRCRAIYEDPDHDCLWVGTEQGLNRIRLGSEGHPTGKVQRIAGLPSQTILGIVADESESLWLSTPDGLVRMSNRNDVEPDSVIVEREIGPSLLGFNAPAIRSRSSELLFGTSGGLIEVRPEHFESGPPPPVAITGLKIGSGLDDWSQTKSARLTHEQNSVISFKFAALDFASPGRNRFAYRLDGFEKEWHHGAADQWATYTTLRPGNYTFRVKASNSRGVWNDEGASFELTILPPWWATWWARCLALAGLVGLTIAIVKLKGRRIREHNRLLQLEVNAREGVEGELRDLATRLIHAQENERRHIARELHDDLTQRLAAMAMDTRVADKEIDESPERAHKDLRAIQLELTEMATATQELSRSLHPKILEELGLAKAIRSECRRFAKRTDLNVIVDVGGAEGVDHTAEQSLCLYRILQEALANLGKHSKASHAEVTLRSVPEGTVLSIEDDGIGFDVRSKRSGESLGMASMAERARLCGASLEIESKPGEGTLISVSLPKQTNHDSE